MNHSSLANGNYENVDLVAEVALESHDGSTKRMSWKKVMTQTACYSSLQGDQVHR